MGLTLLGPPSKMPLGDRVSPPEKGQRAPASCSGALTPPGDQVTACLAAGSSLAPHGPQVAVIFVTLHRAAPAAEWQGCPGTVPLASCGPGLTQSPMAPPMLTPPCHLPRAGLSIIWGPRDNLTETRPVPVKDISSFLISNPQVKSVPKGRLRAVRTDTKAQFPERTTKGAETAAELPWLPHAAAGGLRTRGGVPAGSPSHHVQGVRDFAELAPPSMGPDIYDQPHVTGEPRGSLCP